MRIPPCLLVGRSLNKGCVWCQSSIAGSIRISELGFRVLKNGKVSGNAIMGNESNESKLPKTANAKINTP